MSQTNLRRASLTTLAAFAETALPDATWELKTPADKGMGDFRLTQLAEQLGERGCVIKDGCAVKTWDDQKQRRDWFTSAKPLPSTMVFFAIEEGLVKSVD
jgi:hypothetical protein